MSLPIDLAVDSKTLKIFAKKAAIGSAIGIGSMILPGVILSVAGFSSGGVVPGSMAALWQSSIGNVVVGSSFALCQSVGAAGLSVPMMVSIGTTGVLIGTSAKFLANGSVHGIKLLGSGVSSTSQYVFGIVKSKL